MPNLKSPEDARILIEAAWHEWKHREGLSHLNILSATHGLAFYGYIERHKPHLLDFEYHGDKWQLIHSWLLQDGQVRD